MGPYITTGPLLPAAIVGQPYTQAFTSVRGTPPVSYTLAAASAAPPGLTLTSAGVLSGTPTAAGVFAFTVVATDAAALSDEQPCTLQAYQSVPAPAGMVGWWKAEGNALDSAGTNNGVLQGGAGYAAGEVGQAFSLDGSTGCVQIPDAPALQPASLTLEAWVLFGSTSGLRTSSPSQSAPEHTTPTRCGWTPEPSTGQVCDVPAAVRNSRARPADRGNVVPRGLHRRRPPSNRRSTSTASRSPAEPPHCGPRLRHPAAVPRPRHRKRTPTNFLQGLIDEASIYNRALTPAEIASIYNAGPAGKAR